MPRNQGTSRKGKPKKEMRSAGFGKALIRSQTKRHTPKSNGSSAHGQGMISTGAATIGVVEESDAARMKSVLEMDDLSDFLVQAQLANKDFVSEREQFLDLEEVGREYVPTGQTGTGAIIRDDDARGSSSAHGDGGGGGGGGRDEFAFHELSVPRRPRWTPGVTTPEELESMENESFLDWRRGVARKEEEIAALAFEAQRRNGVTGARGNAAGTGASVTPYEKNLHVWRQLWRVLERSAVVIQIVDARNPLFYLSDDLRQYAAEELGKPMLVVVNKSDYLTGAQRRRWSEYLTGRGVDHLFFSAHVEQKKIDEAASRAKRGDSMMEEGAAPEEVVVTDEDESDAKPLESDPAPRGSERDVRRPSDESLGITQPLTREELLNALDAFADSHGCTPDEKYDNRIQYGMVGFPNVGKSSVINVLMGSSKNIHGVVRVGVAAQPGKTKHFQTLLLPDRPQTMLCDCPGLVFPSFVSSSADMIAAGVYPIAQMRDHWPVVDLICRRVPRVVLNAHYGINLPQPSEQELRERGLWRGKAKTVLPPPTSEELLGTYCVARSMLAPSSGVPDYQRASRVVVKDYSEGKLLYCHAPPASLPSSNEGDPSSATVEEDEAYRRETIKTAIRNTNNAKKLQKLEQSLSLEAAARRKKSEEGSEEEDDFDDFDSILDDLDGEEDPNKGDKRGKSHKSIKKWGKKGRKLRNKDPYGCHSDPDSVLKSASTSSGAIVNAGKYSSSYTRANYAGAKAATQFEGRANRPKKKGR